VLLAMSGSNNQNWGKKGFYIGVFATAFFLFVILLIWVYGMNGNGLQ